MTTTQGWTRKDYEHALEALGICISARVPVLLWGNPGEGKTAVVESARSLGWYVETLIVSHYEPSDFAGLPVVSTDGSVNFAPPGWAQRLAAVEGPPSPSARSRTPDWCPSTGPPRRHHLMRALKSTTRADCSLDTCPEPARSCWNWSRASRRAAAVSASAGGRPDS